MLWAAEHGRLDIIKELYETDNSLLMTKDKDGYTPLHRASYNDHFEVAQVYIAYLCLISCILDKVVNVFFLGRALFCYHRSFKKAYVNKCVVLRVCVCVCARTCVCCLSV